jgi:mRNA-degrading endonuclease RelE of RelBE toxin-antitoxin system
MSDACFKVIFAPDEEKEYKKLDNSVLYILDKAIDELEY